MNTCFKREEASATAFLSAADAWFWTMRALRARHEGISRAGAGVKRPCEPDDVVRCLDRLYRNQHIGLRHARVLRAWGERQTAPDARSGTGDDAQLWREALCSLEGPLQVKGIVRPTEKNPIFIGKKSLTSHEANV